MKERHALFIVQCIMTFTTLLCMCNHGVPENDKLAYVGSTLITRQDADAFEFVTRYMPGEQDSFGLAKGGKEWSLIATEAIWQKVRLSHAGIGIRHSKEWEWKKRAFLSKAFEVRILQGNCGYSDSEVRNYYDTHRDEFMTGTVTASAGKPCTTEVVSPFDSVRGNAAKKLFLSNYKPDSISMDLRNPRLFGMFRERMYRDFFLRKFYKEKYGKPFPDSVNDLCGGRKMIDTGDVSVILSWMPADQYGSFKKDPRMLQNRLIQLKLFSEKAVASGYASKPEVKKVLEWAWKNEIAQRYVNESIAPAARKNVRMDSAMARYSYWDENGSPGAAIDPAKFTSCIARLYSQQVSEKFDRLIYEIRRTRQVRFLHPDTWSDGRVQDPEKLLRGADSLRDIGAIAQARAMYSILTDYYVFTDEGKKALIELAKIQAEQQGQSRFEAIKNYRRFLILDNDRSKQCEVMFRIGFLYDRYLNRAGMAEVNYRWVLKNAPDCRFAGDAEVMLQHLGEPMPGGEELRDEAKRQGKKTEL